MKSAIEKLFYGNFYPLEAPKPTAEQLKRMEAAEECDEKLTELLKGNEEALNLFEKFKDATDENTCAEVFLFYKEGFRNGFQLALDGAQQGD